LSAELDGVRSVWQGSNIEATRECMVGLDVEGAPSIITLGGEFPTMPRVKVANLSFATLDGRSCSDHLGAQPIAELLEEYVHEGLVVGVEGTEFLLEEVEFILDNQGWCWVDGLGDDDVIGGWALAALANRAAVRDLGAPSPVPVRTDAVPSEVTMIRAGIRRAGKEVDELVSPSNACKLVDRADDNWREIAVNLLIRHIERGLALTALAV
jgi:hypothetical protein